MRYVIAALLLAASSAHGQTISPLISEYSAKHASGEFSVTNNTIQPMAVTVEANSFSLAPGTGQPILRPLDPTAHVDLSEMSSRLGPKATHAFGYRIRCEALPCMIQFSAGMVVGRTANGMAVRIVLPTVAYVCAKEKNCRRDTRRAAGLLN